MESTLEELIEKRERYIEVSKENDFEKGLRNLLSNMYPDEAHFIYELLQNAEDKKAKNVYFKLYKDKLIFEHDGGVYDSSQLFNLKDIEAITAFSDSTKKNDPTSIGKFGVGFKAVFAYTETPQIYSGQYSFEIHDMLVPKIIKNPNDLKNGFTRFVFPFNSQTKSIEEILTEIRSGLINIKDNTLLFLKNIESISYEIYDGKLGEFLRIDNKENIVTLVGKGEETSWLRFDKEITIQDEEDSKLKNCRINVAFKLDSDKAKEIVPTNAGVSIYFPAKKEVSNLKFIINAPFASTIARDSVRSCKSNKILINEIAIFMKEVLGKLYNYGYMKMSFLKVLPNNEDNIPELYIPILKSIYEEYKIKPYFITLDNKLDYLKNVVKAYRANVYELFNNEDIKQILENNQISWMKNPNLENSSPESKFLRMFNINEYKAFDLLRKNTLKLKDILLIKDYKWFNKLFKQIKRESQDDECVNLNNLYDISFIPTIDGKFLTPNDCYYVDANVDVGNFNNIVKTEIYCRLLKDNKLDIDNDIVSFFKNIGIKKFNIKAQIEFLLAKYKYPQQKNKEENLKDLRQFIELCYNYFYYEYDSERWKLKKLVEDTKFILVKNEYFSICDLTLGKPYVENSFYALLKTITGKGPEIIPDCCIDKKFVEKLLYVCKELDVYKDLKIYTDPGGGCIGKDHWIPYLKETLEAENIILSAKLWNFLVSEGTYLISISKQRYQGQSIDSDFIEKLKSFEWIPDKNNKFHKPSDIYIESMPKEFLKENCETLIDLLEIKSKRESNKKLEEILKENNIGIPTNKVRSLNEINEKYPDAINKFILDFDKEFDKERRKNKNLEEVENAPEIKSEIKERAVRNEESKIDASSYLDYMYHDKFSDRMICQICNKGMPFRKSNKKWYFEDVEMFSRDVVGKADECTHLCLCPTCSAKYNEYIKRDKEKQRKIIDLINVIDDNNKIQIELDSLSEIVFSSKHFFDLKIKLPALLNNNVEKDIEENFEENIEEEKTGRNKPQAHLFKPSVVDKLNKAVWQEINEDDIIKIGYYEMNLIFYVKYKDRTEYFENVSRSKYNEILNANYKKVIIENDLKSNYYYNTL